MKKTNILAAIIILSSAISVFGNVPVLNNRIDSLNYALGIANGNSVKMYYMNNDVTDEKVQSLMKGMDEVINNKSEYYELELLGATMGSAMKQQSEGGLMGIEDQGVKFELLKQGLINGLRGHDVQMTSSQANAYLQIAMQDAQVAQIEKMYGENRKAGEEFLAENATKEGVVVLPSGLQYKIIKQGKGAIPTATDRVRVHYHGTLIDGTVFDSSVDRGESIDFPVNGVIRCWTEALQLMPVGSKWMLYIPQDLAYGAADRSTIKPYSALIFEVELLGIEK